MDSEDEEIFSLWKSLQAFAHEIIYANDFNNYMEKAQNPRILNLLKHYSLRRDDMKGVEKKVFNYKKLKKYFDKLIKEDRFVDLTLTYDFEPKIAKKKQLQY